MESLSFVDWMRQALHDPESGYYAARVRTVGRAGDFSTSASAGGVLSEAIANWLREETGSRHVVRTVIEAGGGDGSLSAEVRRRLGWWRRHALDWCMVETSPRLRQHQQAKLGTSRVRWFKSMSEALHSCGGRALLFHNELVDAFAVRVLQWNEGLARWDELWLRNESGTWREEWKPSPPDEAAAHDHVALSPSQWCTVPLRDRQRIELHADYCQWLRNWAPEWRAGAMLTVDYGAAFPQLYHRRPHGTVRAYFHHQRLTGEEVYARMGRQDITADVNFTDLAAWGESLGWETVHLTTQHKFLQSHVKRSGACVAQDAAAAFLADDHGAGSAFKVLLQRVRDEA